MSQNARVIAALAAGLAAGAAAARLDAGVLSRVLAVTDVTGTLWLNAIRMTVVPLVVALLITGVAGAAHAGAVGAIALRALIAFLALLTGAAAIAAIAGLAAIRWMPGGTIAPPASHADLSKPLSLTDWFSSIIPANPIGAAADGAMLPLIVFSFLFALALIRLDAARRDPVISFFRSIGDAMLVIIGWVLIVAPAGVFALAFGVAVRSGAAAAGALAFFVALFTATLIIIAITLLPAAVVWSRVPLVKFARAAAPALAVAFSSRSSLAALPAAIEAAHRLGFAAPVTGFALPLAASVFRLSVPVSFIIGAIFTSSFYGVHLDTARFAMIFVLSILLSFSVPGIPHSSFLIMVPVFQSAGLPVEAVGVLLAVDAIPDIFKTVLNVTGHLTSAAMVARGEATSTSSFRAGLP